MTAAAAPAQTRAAAVYVDDRRVWLDDHPEGVFANEDHDKSVEYWLAFLVAEVATLSERVAELERRSAGPKGPRNHRI